MNFGKNRVQYKNFYWQYFRYPKYDIYFNINGRELAEYAAPTIERELSDIVEIFNFSFKKRILFIIYNTHTDFKQSNIGSGVAEEHYNIGGVSRILENKVILYFEGVHNRFDQQIREGIASIVVRNILYSTNSYREMLASSAAANLPEWFEAGLISYLAKDWSPSIHDEVKMQLHKDAFVKPYHLEGNDAIIIGHAFWKYISVVYGKEAIGNITYMTRLSRSIESGFYYVLGKSLDSLFADSKSFYEERMNMQTDSLNNEYTPIIKRAKRNMVIGEPSISPNGRYCVYTTNILGQYKIWLFDTETQKRTRILKKEYKLERITDYSYPKISWHPSGKLFAILFEQKGKIWYSLYVMDSQELITRRLHHYDKIIDFEYSPDGYKFVFSAINKGQSDIYIHDIVSHTNIRVTNDLADDIMPIFAIDGKSIIFSSNRLNDSVYNSTDSVASTFDLYCYDIDSKTEVLERYSSTPYDNETYPKDDGKGNILYLSDQTGINGLFLSKRDSSVGFIDTAIHYNYYLKTKPLVNTSQNISFFDNYSSTYFATFRHGGKYNIYEMDTYMGALKEGTLTKTFFKNAYIRKQVADSLKAISIEKDTVKQLPQKAIINKPDSLIDHKNYKFEFEEYENEAFDTIYSWIDKSELVTPSVYKTSFYVNKVVNQVDFGFVSASYQSYSGGAYYYNPGLNLFFKLGVVDLFEDYKLTGGVRFAGDFESNEYILSIENIKHRLDKQLIFHRQSILKPTQISYNKIIDHELMFALKYPFDVVRSISVTPSFRYDKEIILSIDPYSLREPTYHKYWTSLKGEYVFDNTLSKGLNLHEGVRYKIFCEGYSQIDNLSNYLVVWGVDFRSYTRLHRNVIWANRFAYSSSYGTAKLLYYLGSVDNWINVFTNYDTYNNSVEVDQDQNWVYQSIATNLRGFNQNIRNGNSFALINSEIRVPVVKYILNRNVNSDFLNNLQCVGFFDVGTAWYGIIPKKENNSYNYTVIDNETVKIIIDNEKQPYVYGYGFGVRSKVFGYFMRADWAWGVDDGVVMPNIFYLSLSLDF